jgi:serine/threonine-protein kinase
MLDQRVAGRYRLEGPLGRGTMATVWRGRDEVLGRAVAVKMLADGSLQDASAVKRFGHEAHTVAGLGHPNIVTLFDAGVDEGVPYLVMELIEGSDLAALIAGGSLLVSQVVTIADQVCAALAAAHRAGVVHRDLKPANLLLTQDGTVKVVDFGIARTTLTARAGLTGPATVLGTISYMAPEQATGAVVDARADLYALGCLIHATLTGQPPFTGEDPRAVLHQHLHQPPTPLRQIRADVPKDLEHLVLDLLAKDPGQRPPDAESVRERLSACGPSVAAAPTSPSAPPSRAPGRGGAHKRGAAAAVRPQRTNGRRPVLLGAVALLAAGTVGYFIATLESPAPPASAAGPTPAPSASAAGPTPAPSASAAGSSTGPSASGAPTTARVAAMLPGRSPSPAASTPRPVTVADVLALVNQGASSGALAPDAAQDARNRLQDINQQIVQGNLPDATHKIADMRQHLADLQQQGKVTAPAAARIESALDALAAAPPVTSVPLPSLPSLH